MTVSSPMITFAVGYLCRMSFMMLYPIWVSFVPDGMSAISLIPPPAFLITSWIAWSRGLIAMLAFQLMLTTSALPPKCWWMYLTQASIDIFAWLYWLAP